MIKSLREALSLGMEGVVDGNLHKEIEYTFYARIKDPAQLEKAVKKEEHEQWRLPLGVDVPGLRARLREIDGRRWVICTKHEREGAIGWDEVECDISKDMFATLKMAATDGYKKTRYEFPIPGSTSIWEVDVFVGPGGDKSLWVKIDLEVQDPHAAVPELPLDYDEIITNQPSQQTQDEAAFIAKLWGSEWQKLDEA